MALSDSTYLRIVTGLFNLITFGYAIVYVFYPLMTVQVFEFDRVPTADERYFFDPILALLGIKAFFISFAVSLAALFATPKHLGALEIGTGIMAICDGVALKHYVGHGEWNHWGYSWMCILLGIMLFGVFDPLFGGTASRKTQKNA